MQQVKEFTFHLFRLSKSKSMFVVLKQPAKATSIGDISHILPSSPASRRPNRGSQMPISSCYHRSDHDASVSGATPALILTSARPRYMPSQGKQILTHSLLRTQFRSRISGASVLQSIVQALHASEPALEVTQSCFRFYKPVGREIRILD